MNTVDFAIYKGDSLSYKIPVNDLAGVAKVWTTETVICKLKANKTDTASVLSLTTADNSIVKATGFLTLQKTTPGLSVGTYYYDIQVTYTDSTIETIQEGTIEIMQDVS